MNTDKIIKEARIIMITCSIVGLLLLGLGIFLNVMDINLISNKKAIIGLSFIPFSVAVIYYLKIFTIKKSPNKVKNIIINENDERIVALKNEASAKAFKIVQGAVFLSYMGYTLLVPEHIFESVGWWLLMVLLFVTFMSNGILTALVMKNNNTDDIKD